MSATMKAARPVFLWVHPRSLSTAFERVFIERGDFTVFHEPFAQAFFFGPERGHSRFKDQLVKADCTFEAIWNEIQGASASKEQPCFVKELAFHLCTTSLRNEIMEKSTHTFLIRHPSKALASMHKKLPDFDWTEAGYEALFNIFEASLQYQSGPPIVIDADDLQQCPEDVMRGFCSRIDVSFVPSSLGWEPKVIPAWQAWEGWHDEAQFSNGFLPKTSKMKEEDLPDRVLQMIERAMPLYIAMKSHCYPQHF